jgi:hypothetical protein
VCRLWHLETAQLLYRFAAYPYGPAVSSSCVDGKTYLKLGGSTWKLRDAVPDVAEQTTGLHRALKLG